MSNEASFQQLKSRRTRPRVLVAMSGGVDSSVAAALLVEQGYEVVGVTMQVWDYSSCDIEEGNGTCCSSVDVDDARSVADKLAIPFYVINCEAKFKASVIDPFIASYLQGETPLPCVDCNTYLKFDHLIEKMLELDCDFLATGHYAKIETTISGRSVIATSTDDWKDQTYFLFTIDPNIVSRLMFPIGHLKKPEVREIAEQKNLINARKKDSTGICFVGNRGYDNFIEEHVSQDVLKTKKGNIVLYPSGEILAAHQGIHHFTYGQRKGLGIGGRGDLQGSSAEPLFVLKIDAQTNTVWIGLEKYLFSQKVTLKKPHWLDDVKDGERLRVKIRFQHKGAYGRIQISGDKVSVDFEEPVRAVTPGQAAVMYRDSQLVGGAWIV